MISGKEKDLGIFYNEDFDSAAQQVCKVVNQQWTWIDSHSHNKSSIYSNPDSWGLAIKTISWCSIYPHLQNKEDSILRKSWLSNPQDVKYLNFKTSKTILEER